jgi:hypothetical protein
LSEKWRSCSTIRSRFDRRPARVLLSQHRPGAEAVRARLSRAAKQTIFAFVPAALGLLALILTAAAVQIVGAQLFRDASEIAGFAPRY